MSNQSLKVQYIVCKPMTEYVYTYSFNTATKPQAIDKDKLKALLRLQISYDLYKEACYLIDSFEFFLVDLLEESLHIIEVESEINNMTMNYKDKTNKYENKLLTYSNKFSNLFKGLSKKENNLFR